MIIFLTSMSFLIQNAITSKKLFVETSALSVEPIVFVEMKFSMLTLIRSNAA